MSEKVIDADFVRRVVQGSANIDRMRKEIHQVITLLVSLIPTDIPRNGWHHLAFSCPMERVPDQYRNLTWIRWEITQESVSKDGKFFGKQKPIMRAKIALVAS